MENYDIFGWNKAGLEVVPAGCPACQDSDVILEGHFKCWLTDRKIVQGPILTDSGWYALVE